MNSPKSTGLPHSNNGITKRRRKTINDDGSHPHLHSHSLSFSHSHPPTIAASDSPPVRNISPIAAPTAGGGSSSSFRNVSACNRCRLRKNRCDQRLPACMSCEKAGVRCVGYDPITKREIPRSYVHYLETRVVYLEALLSSNSIPFPPADDFPDLPPAPPTAMTALSTPTSLNTPYLPSASSPAPIDPALSGQYEHDRASPLIKREPVDALDGNKLESLVSDIGLVSFAGASDPRYLGSVSGISFARVVFAAVKNSSPNEPNTPDSGKCRTSKRTGNGNRGSRGLGMGGAATRDDADGDVDLDTQMRDSFFGLHTKPTISPAPFPTRPVAERLVNLYFEHANPQIPSLHRGQFNNVIETIYAPVSTPGATPTATDYGIQGTGLGGTARERYLLNIVCAIGAGIFLSRPEQKPEKGKLEGEGEDSQEAPRKKRKVSPGEQTEVNKQYEPEAYHASAMLHLEAYLSGSKGGLEELQAVLLLAGYALLRPVSPGLWYIVGVAMRLAVDLGLHYEDTNSIAQPTKKKSGSKGPKSEKEGRKEWVTDMRRRLWWCVYNLDRLVGTCVGRPFGIADEVISTQFPSILDDEYIHPTKGIIDPPPGTKPQSYKVISHHYLRLRLLQSEILQVLQKQPHTFSLNSTASESAMNKKGAYKGTENYPKHHPYHLQTPYLRNYTSLQIWHKDVDRRLKQWIDSAPKSREETGVAFSPDFLELNYWQAKIMLYRPCLSVPVPLAAELGSKSSSARSRAAEAGLGKRSRLMDKAGNEEKVYLIVAEAGSKVLRIYRQLHRVHQVNYTFLATHHLFMAGISFLYAIWYSPLVRAHLSMDEVDFTILAATSVLGDLIDKCPPAEACRDAFERMSRATVQMCLSGKRGPNSTVVPSGITHQPPQESPQPQYQQPQRQSFEYQEAATEIKREDTGYQLQQQKMYPNMQGLNQPMPHISPPQQHGILHRSSSVESYSIHSSDSRRRQTIQFDDGFSDLFSSPRQLASPPYVTHPYATPPHDAMQYHPSVYAHTSSHLQGVGIYRGEMVIDPALQRHHHHQQHQPQHHQHHHDRHHENQPQQQEFDIPSVAEWMSMDMSNFGNNEQSWSEKDNLSEEGCLAQVDLFDGFFFGGAGN